MISCPGSDSAQPQLSPARRRRNMVEIMTHNEQSNLGDGRSTIDESVERLDEDVHVVTAICYGLGLDEGVVS